MTIDIDRRTLLAGVVGAAFATAPFGPLPNALAVPTPPPLLNPRRVIFGTSVTRLSAVSIRSRIPYVFIDGVDNAVPRAGVTAGTAYQMDGRGFTVPPTNGGLSIVDGFYDQLARGAIRSGNTAKDWCVFEASRGLEPVAAMAGAVDLLLSECSARGLRAAFLIPHVYLPASDGQSPTWNEDVRAMLLAKVPAAGGVLRDWDIVVWQTQLVYPSLTQAQKDLGQPLLYDGRHPTGGAQANPGPGTARLAEMMAEVTGL